MSRRAGARLALTAVDGVSTSAVIRVATRLAATDKSDRAGVSRWDASGIFGDIVAGVQDVERPSARTLLLLYAADLAFRLRWEIQPALAAGRRVIAAPYVDTAIALGRASGLDDAWLRTMFQFAPPATDRRYVEGTPVGARTGQGFIEFACRRMAGTETRSARQDLVARTQARLKATRNR